jgi:hypothetical protein
LIRSIDTGSDASAGAVDAAEAVDPVDAVAVVDVVDVVDVGCAVCAVCPAYATTDEQMTLIVNSDSRKGAVFVMAVTSNREPLQAEGILIVAPGGPSRKCCSRPAILATP